MICLDGSTYTDNGMMKAALASFVDRQQRIANKTVLASSQQIRQPHETQAESLESQVQGLAQGQHVYVLHKAVKKFGSLITLNGSNHAIVIPDGGYNPVPFSFDQVLSM